MLTVSLTGEPLYAENLHMAIKRQDLNELEAVLKSGYVCLSVPFILHTESDACPVQRTYWNSYKYYITLNKPKSKKRKGSGGLACTAVVCFR